MKPVKYFAAYLLTASFALALPEPDALLRVTSVDAVAADITEGCKALGMPVFGVQANFGVQQFLADMTQETGLKVDRTRSLEFAAWNLPEALRKESSPTWAAAVPASVESPYQFEAFKGKSLKDNVLVEYFDKDGGWVCFGSSAEALTEALSLPSRKRMLPTATIEGLIPDGEKFVEFLDLSNDDIFLKTSDETLAHFLRFMADLNSLSCAELAQMKNIRFGIKVTAEDGIMLPFAITAKSGSELQESIRNASSKTLNASSYAAIPTSASFYAAMADAANYPGIKVSDVIALVKKDLLPLLESSSRIERITKVLDSIAQEATQTHACTAYLTATESGGPIFVSNATVSNPQTARDLATSAKAAIQAELDALDETDAVWRNYLSISEDGLEATIHIAELVDGQETDGLMQSFFGTDYKIKTNIEGNQVSQVFSPDGIAPPAVATPLSQPLVYKSFFPFAKPIFSVGGSPANFLRYFVSPVFSRIVEFYPELSENPDFTVISSIETLLPESDPNGISMVAGVQGSDFIQVFNIRPAELQSFVACSMSIAMAQEQKYQYSTDMDEYDWDEDLDDDELDEDWDDEDDLY